jgi:hypothetical protein
MTTPAPVFELIPGVAEIHRFGDGPARLLLEVPHGATERAHYDAVADWIESPLPPDLEKFFHVNTDFAAPEIALRVASVLSASKKKARPRGVVVVRALVPRTFVDLNREIGEGVQHGMTPGLPPYVSAGSDIARLTTLHHWYSTAVSKLYEEVCGAGGLAVALHTFAPRSVDVKVDADIVRSLLAAYRPKVFAAWKLRPPVDFITQDAEGRDLSPPGLVPALREDYLRIGMQSGENATYHLHPATTGYGFAARYPGHVLCLEFRRDLAGAPWRPFAPSQVSARKVARLAAPLAAELGACLQRAPAIGLRAGA